MPPKILVTSGAILAVAFGILSLGGPAQPQPQSHPTVKLPAGGLTDTVPAPASIGKAAVVKIASGKIQGAVFNDVAIYRGLPYAAAPVANLRWRAPRPATPWKGVRDASEYGKSCTAPPTGSEDCLFLNVYKPADAKPGAKLPVMFWIHGGGFTGGSGSTFDGSPFAKKGVVFVSINYRMGRAGWFAHPAITKNTPRAEPIDNFGLQDQLAALRWVNKNIGAFGGDKNNVTVAGESAGAVSVLYLVSLEASRGLFQKAIAESGFGLYPAFTADQAEKAGAAYFARKGITGNSAATLAAMRKIPWADLQDPSRVGETQPIVDGKLITADTGTTFSDDMEMKIPLLLGGNSNEASLWRTADPAARLRRLDDLPAAYKAGAGDDANRILSRVITDYYIGEGDREMARWHTRNGAATYRYYFSYLTPAQRTTQTLGLGHGGEVRYVFGQKIADPEDTALSEAVQAYWIAFIKSGMPAAAGGPAWPKYDLTTEPVMEFGSAGPVVRHHMFDDRYDWVRDHREMIGMTADPGTAPLVNSNPAHEGLRQWAIQ